MVKTAGSFLFLKYEKSLWRIAFTFTNPPIFLIKKYMSHDLNWKLFTLFENIISYKKIWVNVCLFWCPIIAHEPLDRCSSRLDWGTRYNHGNFNNFNNFKLSGLTCIAKTRDKSVTGDVIKCNLYSSIRPIYNCTLETLSINPIKAGVSESM